MLVRPETPANVGATARIVRNTGLATVALVSPGDWRNVECWRTAWGAHDLLEEAVRFDVVSVVWPRNSRRPQIRHIRGAFEAVGRWQMHA